MLDLEKRLQSGFPRRLVDNLGEKLDFYKGWFDGPMAVGAIAPTSVTMAREMASVIRLDSSLPVLELGPGNGPITKAILERGIAPEKLVAVEYSESFLPGLRRRYPGVNFIHGDAFNIAQIAKQQGIEKFDTIISSLPLLNFSVIQRLRFVEMMLDLLEPGRPMVQFSYGPRPPIPARSRRYAVRRLGQVLRNLPPARIWVYQRPPEVAPRRYAPSPVDVSVTRRALNS